MSFLGVKLRPELDWFRSGLCELLRWHLLGPVQLSHSTIFQPTSGGSLDVSV